MAKKSQAAMEFLMTYGWAILVVLVAVGALSYFGVLSPDQFLPGKCTLPPGIACIDHKATNFIGAGFGELYVVLKNGLGYDLSSISISATSCSSSVSYPILKNGEKITLTASDCDINAGEKYSGQINVTYTNVDTGLQHTSSGALTAKVGDEIT
ncbi:hypothetical protein ISS05_05615 [Candidatus Woesearchaeota archaeon]|nr:hypothetical protein [Candidatus Woesearchaeota archaeon]